MQHFYILQCQNNCDELGAADRIERERLEKQVQEGLRLKAELASKGKFCFYLFSLIHAKWLT